MDYKSTKDYEMLLEHFDINFLITNSQRYNFKPDTVIATVKSQPFTVANMLKAITYYLDFIKSTFDCNLDKYSQTLTFLKTINLILNNVNKKRPEITKEMLHFVVDVFHEISDIQANDATKRTNAQMSLALNLLIDFAGRGIPNE